jgi:SOS response regulatory protein OraA/RecX
MALFYCAKRETSRPKLKLYLTRKFISRKESEEKNAEIAEWIDYTLNEMERLKVIDHERFAGILSREYSRRGKGKRYVQQKLKEKGVAEEIPNIEFTEDDELEKACMLVEKTLRRSNFQKIEDRFELRQKLMQRLISSGFELSVAKKAISLKV